MLGLTNEGAKMTTENKTQLLVIGAGPGGYVAAFLAADMGQQVTLIDSNQNPGGICLQKGCIPSKTLLHAAKIITESKEAEEFGLSFESPRIDINKLRDFKNITVEKLTKGLSQLCKARNINYIQGKASFVDSNTITIQTVDGNTEELQFDKAILAVGSEPTTLPGVNYSDKIMDSTTALKVKDIPSSLLIVGGGYIGLELGTVYSALGSNVSVVEMTDNLLPGADQDLVRPLERRLKNTFKEILLKTKLCTIEESADGVSVQVEDHDGKLETKTFDKVLIAIGRKPYLDELNIPNTKIEIDEKGFVKVNAQRQTTDPSIYAIGDISGEPMLAHKASAEGHTAVKSILGNDCTFEPKAIPAVVFTDPEIAWCGITESQAKAENINITVSKFPWAASGRALSLNRTEGMTKLILDPETQKILGVGIVGVSAGELIAEGVLAIEMGATACDLIHCIHPHPTLSETIMESAENFFGKSPHIYKPKK